MRTAEDSEFFCTILANALLIFFLIYILFISYIYILSLLAPGPARSVKLLRLSFSQLKLTWQAPGRPNGIITEYNVTWQMVSNDKLKSVIGVLSQTIVSKEKTFYVINDLGRYRCQPSSEMVLVSSFSFLRPHSEDSVLYVSLA